MPKKSVTFVLTAKEMQEYIVKIIDTEYLNDDVKRFVIEKPQGYRFIPGQSLWVSIGDPASRSERRPFSFTGLNKWEYLELIIKINYGYEGFTFKLDQLRVGDNLVISDPWGTIQYKGDGTFIAAGSGITPFIAVLRQLKEDNEIHGDTLIWSNQMVSDLFLDEELEQILDERYFRNFTRQFVVGFREKRIDLSYLKSTIRNFNHHFYICGPRVFVEDIMKLLSHLGISMQVIVFEENYTGINLPPASSV